MSQVRKPARRKQHRPANQAVSKKAAAAPAEAIKPAPIVRLSAWQQLTVSLRFFGRNWRFFLAFTIVFAVLNLVLVHSLVGNVADMKKQLSTIVGGNTVLTGLSTYALLLANNSSISAGNAAYKYVLLVISSLAVIWILRQVMSDAQHDKKPRVRDSLYEGMGPFVQFSLVLITVSLEFLPLAAGAALYGVVLSGNIANNWIEQAFWLTIVLIGLVVTAWLVIRSIFAIYIVTLPGGRPRAALKDAWQITKGHQLWVLRRLLLLIGFMLAISAVLLIPAIFIAAPVTSILVFLFGIVAVPFAHIYLYRVYRELIA